MSANAAADAAQVEILGFLATPYEIVSIVISIVGFTFVVVILRQAYRQMHRHVFCEYMKRLADIYRDLVVQLNEVSQACSLHQRLRFAIAFGRYLNLCSEEYHLRLHGFLHHTSWSIWERGIDHALAHEDLRVAAENALIE